MKRLALLLLLLAPAYFPSVVLSPQAQDKKPLVVADAEIKFPVPASKTVAIDSGKLTSDLVYVVDGKVPFVVLVSPANLAKVTSEAGPIKIRAKFFGGYGVETRTFAGPQVYMIEAAGVGKVELLAVPNTFKSETDIIRRTVDVDNGQAPQPPPGPGPAPNPPGDLGPFGGAAGLRVLIVYESGKTLPLEQHSTIFGKAFRDYIDAKAVKVGGTPERRIWDQDIVPTQHSKMWQDAMKRPRASVPWIAVGNGAKWFEGPLPATEAATMELLKKFGE